MMWTPCLSPNLVFHKGKANSEQNLQVRQHKVSLTHVSFLTLSLGAFLSLQNNQVLLIQYLIFPTYCVLCANSRIVDSTEACVPLIVSPNNHLSLPLRHQPASNHGRFQEERRNHYRYGRENGARLSFTPKVSSPKDSYGRSSADCSSCEQPRLSRPQLLRFLNLDDRDEQVCAFGDF